MDVSAGERPLDEESAAVKSACLSAPRGLICLPHAHVWFLRARLQFSAVILEVSTSICFGGMLSPRL